MLKLIRWNLSTSELTSESESARAAEYVQTYLECLPYGKSLPDTELQPADDLAILAGHAFVSAWSHSKDESHLYSAVAILEYASGVSKQSYRIRLSLIRIYYLLGRSSIRHLVTHISRRYRCSIPSFGTLSSHERKAGSGRHALTSSIITRHNILSVPARGHHLHVRMHGFKSNLHEQLSRGMQ